ncbi:dihydrolipoamide acetyltransferase family protein [Treponema primitia]|uniref:dihydrolipoamide acetyltransferase family protein n=1 Tax=Treponema primitia TaxID=88058 RepID=UPI00025558D0|nr:dihydrolipoamide acetyltransferase family protein [Treponema primitia]
MANSIIMPKTGMAMEEGVILEWRVTVGDTVKRGDIVALIETDKSTMELESDYTGEILAILSQAGETIPVTKLIAWVGQHGEAVPAEGKFKATPAARKLAGDKGIVLSAVSPSGKSGEIRRGDVERAAAGTLAALAAAVASRPDTRLPLTNIQRITGKRMLESRLTIPDVTQNTRADVTTMLSARKKLSEKLGIKITVNDLLLAAVVKALKAHPRLNSVLDGNELIYKGSINLGIAVATERGLLVPVIHNAQELSLRQISAQAADLAGRAREGHLTSDEMSGGTFTVSNVGMYGITAFTPIINPPEAAILGVCSVEDELKLEGEKVLSRKIMGLSLTFDHRIVDGAAAAAFIKTLRELLESPVP